jgi:cation diffusion facilitator family transporter
LNVLEALLLVLMRRIHRGRTHAYDYGAGKLEQFANLTIGTAMGIGGLWVGITAAYRWYHPPEQEELGLAFAVTVGAVNLVQNGLAFLALWHAGRDGTSLIMAGQIRTRLSKLVSSAIVLVALIVNAFAGPVWGHLAEVIGSAFVALVMLQLSIAMWRDSLPSLLDRTLDEGRQQAINRVLSSHFEAYDELESVRSRMSGNTAIIEVILGFDAGRSIGEVQDVVDAVSGDVAALVPGAQVSVVPVAAGWAARQR